MIPNETQEPLGRAICAKVWSEFQLQEGHAQVMRLTNDGTEKSFEQLQFLAKAEEAFRRAIGLIKIAGRALHDLDNLAHDA